VKRGIEDDDCVLDLLREVEEAYGTSFGFYIEDLNKYPAVVADRFARLAEELAA
jgi:hypothetical protein